MPEEKSVPTNTNPTAQPGAVITPGQAAPAVEEAPPQTSVAPPQESLQPAFAAEPEPNPYQENSLPLTEDNQSIQWTASEFIAHEKSAGWYARLGFGALVIAAIVYLPTKDKISAAVILIGALFLGFYAGRQPKQLDYQVDAQGVQVGQKYHAFSEFRSFSVVPEGAFSSVVFVPMKRFSPLFTIYYPPDEEDKILSVISRSLPLEERGQDPVDNLMRRIRF